MLRRTVRRRQFLEFMAKLEPTVIGLEACGASHHWARELGRLGHRVMLIPPQYVKPYVTPGSQERQERCRGDLRGDEPAAGARAAGAGQERRAIGQRRC